MTPGHVCPDQRRHELDQRILNRDRLAAPTAAPPQQEPREHRHVVVPAETRAALGAVGWRANDRLLRLRAPPQDADVEEAPDQQRPNTPATTMNEVEQSSDGTRDLVQKNAGGDRHVERLDAGREWNADAARRRRGEHEVPRPRLRCRARGRAARGAPWPPGERLAVRRGDDQTRRRAPRPSRRRRRHRTRWPGAGTPPPCCRAAPWDW